MKIKYFILYCLLLSNVNTFALDKNQTSDFTPTSFLKLDKTYHFYGEKNGLLIALQFQRKSNRSIDYNIRIEYPNQKVLHLKGIAYSRLDDDMGTEERENPKTGQYISCQSFTPKNNDQKKHLELCIGQDEDEHGNLTETVFVQIIFSKKNYPEINLENSPALLELKK